MEPTVWFTRLVTLPDDAIPLDELALSIAAHDHDVDVDLSRRELDALAARMSTSADAEEVAGRLFGSDCGYAGNTVDYDDPRNSYLDVVLQRRLGLPITLCVLMLEVSRRLDIPLVGVGMPGHFLVRSGDELFDPFRGGIRLDVDACRARFLEMHPSMVFEDRHLDPVGPRAIAGRMLANLVGTFLERDPGSAVWAARLRLRVPGLAAGERRRAAEVLAMLGRFDEAADGLDELAADLGDAGAETVAQDAARLRARAN
jgi:regulator of sirC expression with transglutaminase-like and TPR domain